MSVAEKSNSCHWANLALAAPLHALVDWYRISQERSALRDLPTERLNDMGLTRKDAQIEATRPFWQASRCT